MMKNNLLTLALPLFLIGNSFAQEYPSLSNARYHHGYEVKQIYAEWFDYAGDLNPTISTPQLSSGAQSFTISFVLQSRFPQGKVGVDASAWFALGTDPEIWAKVGRGDDVYFGFGVAGVPDGRFNYVNQYEGGTKDSPTSSEIAAQDLSTVAVKLTFQTGDEFRTSGTKEIEYGFVANFDYGGNGSVDQTIKGTFMDSRWGVNFWLVSEYYVWNEKLGAAQGPEHVVSAKSPSP